MDFGRIYLWPNVSHPFLQFPVARKPSNDGCKHSSENAPSWDIARFALFDRPVGRGTRRPDVLIEPYLAKQLPGLLQKSEHEYDLKEINKIFAAKWLNNNQIIMGSKCNKVILQCCSFMHNASAFHGFNLYDYPFFNYIIEHKFVNIFHQI